jgi:Xaa-Pro dipeptidase
MLTADGCKARRKRLWERLGNAFSGDRLLLGDPLHLMYLANFHVDPFSLGGDYGGLLEMRRDGSTTLWHESRLPQSVKEAYVDERKVVVWYDGKSPAQGPRRLALIKSISPNGEFRVNDHQGDPTAALVTGAIAEMRRCKDDDELSILKACMKATDAGHAWARANIKAGMTELDVYRGVNSACINSAGQAVIVYGDFAVCPGPERHGGPPTSLVLKNGDMFILDYSVVIAGYRSDFTNTLVVGGNPTPQQKKMYDACMAAIAAGESKLKANAACLDVYRAVVDGFDKLGVAQYFTHHAGHGIGLSHPEAPFFVRNATEKLIAGDVVTLEPGVYIEGAGGIRIERNYLITSSGFEQMSNHQITLV